MPVAVRPRRVATLAVLVAVPAAVLAAPAPEAGGESMSPSQFLLLMGLALVAAKIGGELAVRIRQPAVLGELLAGVALGPSVLGRVSGLHLSPDQLPFHLLAEVGVVLLLFEIGLETDLAELLRAGRSSTLVALIGIAVPFALGWGSTLLLLRLGLLDAPQETAGLLAVFMGATLTATSVGITGRVLQDLGRMSSPEARILLGAAVIDDVLGLVILGIVTGVGSAAAAGRPLSDALSPGSIALAILLAGGFLVVALVVGRWGAPRLFDVVDRMGVRGILLVSAVAFALLLAWLADAVGSAMIVGAFAAGLILSGTNQFDQIEHRLKPVTDVFAPIFFVIVGAGVNVATFDVTQPANRGPLLLAAILLVVAVAGKIAAGLGVVGTGISRLVVGVGMVPRGEVGLIFAQAGARTSLLVDGRRVPLLDDGTYSAVTVMIMATTFVAPPALRALFARRPEDR